jgi:hypothetical protein
VDVFAPVADLLKVTLLSALTPDRATTRYPLAEQIVTYVLDNLTDPGLGPPGSRRTCTCPSVCSTQRCPARTSGSRS